MATSADIFAAIQTHDEFLALAQLESAAANTETAILTRSYDLLSPVLNLTVKPARLAIVNGLRLPVKTYTPRPSSVVIPEAVPASLVTLLQNKGYTVVTTESSCVVSGW